MLVAGAAGARLHISFLLLCPAAEAGGGLLPLAGFHLQYPHLSASQPEGFFWSFGNLLSPLPKLAHRGQRFETSRAVGVSG